MITITLIKRSKVKGKTSETKEIKIFKKLDDAKMFASPIANNMKLCRKLKQIPEQEIMAVSYDEDYERQMLINIGAIITNANEMPTNY